MTDPRSGTQHPVDCAHAECACLVAPGTSHCSDYCRAADAERVNDDRRRDPGQWRATGHVCGCGHPECEDRVKTGGAMHEQAR